MVEHYALDTIFKSLADPTRRDILSRVNEQQQSITELAARYKMSFAAIAKHIIILENAKLIQKNKRGKEKIITINKTGFMSAEHYLQDYAVLWNESLHTLDNVLTKENQQ